MSVCSCRPMLRRSIDVYSEPYETSYNRSYFYENVTDQNFIDARVKGKTHPNVLRVNDPLAGLKTLETINETTFVPKYFDNCGSTDFFRRSSLVSRDNLKSLHERYIGDPPRPLKIGSTTTGSTYIVPEKFHEPAIFRRTSPIEQFTLPIPSHCREGLSSFSPNETGYTKYLDPYVTSTQLTHCAFDREQQNGIAKKNIATFYDTIGLPKNRGFGPKRMEAFGAYFPRDHVIPSRVRTRINARVPYFGSTSTYAAHYDLVPTNLLSREEARNDYPAVFRPIENASFYRTEQDHLGTGWPVRGSVDIGSARGIH